MLQYLDLCKTDESEAEINLAKQDILNLTSSIFRLVLVYNFIVLFRDENGRKRSEEASIVFSFTFFLGNDIDNSIDGNEYGADNTGTSETKLSDRE